VALESEIALKVTEKRPLSGMDRSSVVDGLASMGARRTAPAEEARGMPPIDMEATRSTAEHVTALGVVL
jgi:hypothetical protein